VDSQFRTKWLRQCFVYIKEGAKKTPFQWSPAVLDQTGCLYEPYILGALAGEKVKIRNPTPRFTSHATPINNPEFKFRPASERPGKREGL